MMKRILASTAAALVGLSLSCASSDEPSGFDSPAGRRAGQVAGTGTGTGGVSGRAGAAPAGAVSAGRGGGAAAGRSGASGAGRGGASVGSGGVAAQDGSCTITDNGNRTKTVACPGGTVVVFDASAGSIPAGSGIFKGDASISRPADVDALSGYTEVTGNLYVSVPGVTTISWPKLTRVGGYLYVIASSDLATLQIPNLASVGTVYVASNPKLTSLDGLAHLTTVTGGSVTIGSNAALSECAATRFPEQVQSPIISSVSANKPECQPLPADCKSQALDCMKDCAQPNGHVCVDLRPGDATIRNQADLDGLASAEYIEGSLFIQTPNLTAINWPMLKKVNGDIVVESSASLTSLGGLTSLNFVGGRIYVYNNRSLTGLSLPALKAVGGAIQLRNNPALQSISGLGALTTVGGDVDLENNAVLTDVAVANLATIGGQLQIDQNQGLVNIVGLTHLTTVRGGLRLYYNQLLANVDGLSALASIGGDVTISYNYKLQTLGLIGLARIGGSLHIDSNDALTNVAGLAKLTTVASGVTVSSNKMLKTIAGLDSFASAGTALVINGNAALTSIAMPNLSSVGKELTITNNTALTSVAMLKLSSVGGDLMITSNTTLPACAPQALIDSIKLPNIAGIITVSNNAGQCP